MIVQYAVNGTEWTPITTAGQSGSMWLDEDNDGAVGSMNVRIYHATSDTGATFAKSKRVFKPVGNNDILQFSADSSEDIYYARCTNADDSAIISVDAV